MFKLLRHLKNYVGWLLLAFVLLFGQAMCELALPDYMSSFGLGRRGGGRYGVRMAPRPANAAHFSGQRSCVCRAGGLARRPYRLRCGP